MKISDDFYDESENRTMAIIFGIFCGVAAAMATVSYAGAAYVFIGILVGTLLAFKIDGSHHVITLIIYILISLIMGLPSMQVPVILICVLAALSDEVGHELISNYTENVFFNMFFEYRFIMKIVVFLLALCGVFSFWTFIFFILFELSYLMGGLVFEKVIKKENY